MRQTTLQGEGKGVSIKVSIENQENTSGFKVATLQKKYQNLTQTEILSLESMERAQRDPCRKHRRRRFSKSGLKIHYMAEII